MKRLLLVSSFLLIAFSVNATVLYVTKSGGGQHIEVQPAIDAASAGDTILVAPSGGTYQGFTVDRQLTIIGAGTDIVIGRSTRVNGLVRVIDGGDGTVLKGLYVQASIVTYMWVMSGVLLVDSNATDVMVEGCLFENSGNLGWPPSPEFANCAAVAHGASVVFRGCSFWTTRGYGDCWGGYCSDYVGLIIADSQTNIESCIFSQCRHSILGGSYLFVSQTVFYTLFGVSSNVGASSRTL